MKSVLIDFDSQSEVSAFVARGGEIYFENISASPTGLSRPIQAFVDNAQDGDESTLKVSFVKSTLRQISIAFSSSCLVQGSAGNVNIHECYFMNVSQCMKQKRKVTLPQSQMKWVKCEVENSELVGCDNPQYGAVIVPTEETLKMKNSSFERCTITHTPANGSRNSYSSGDVVASSIVFSDLTSQTEVGLAIYAEKTATLTIDSCVFRNISTFATEGNSYGAAVYHEGNGYHKSRGCNYTNCSSNLVRECTASNYGAGAVKMEDGGCDIGSWNGSYYINKVVKESFISSFSLSTQSVRVMIGGINHTEWLPNPPIEDLFVHVSSVLGDDSRSGCGCEVIPCQTIGKGVLQRKDGQWLIVSEGAYSHDCLPVLDMNVNMNGGNVETSTLISCGTGNGKALFEVTTGTLAIEHFTVVHSSSESDPGSSVAGMSGNGKMELSDCEARSKEEDSVPFTKSMIVVEQGLATFRFVGFRNFRSTKQLISFSSPTVISVEAVEFHSITRTIGDGAVLEVNVKSGEELSLNNISFDKCKSCGGNGGGVWVELERGGMFEMGNTSDVSKGVRMRECEAMVNESTGKGGCGGGAYINVGDGADSFVLKRIQFVGCIAAKGKSLFVNAEQLSGLINRNSIGFDLVQSDLEELRGRESSIMDEGASVPLVVFLWTNTTSFGHVGGEDGVDFSRCGFEEAPCSSIKHAIKVWFSEKNRFIKIHSPFVLSEELSVNSYEWNITGSEPETQVEVESSGNGEQEGVVETSVKAWIGDLSVCVGDGMGVYQAVVVCRSGVLSMSKCGMKGSVGVVGLSFVKVVGGQVEISEMGISAIEFGEASTLVAEGGSRSKSSNDGSCCLKVNDSVFEQIRMRDGSVVRCGDGVDVNVKNCTFTSVSRTSGSGGSVCVEDGQSTRETAVVVSESEFEESVVEEDGAGGGGIWGRVTATRKVEIGFCTLKGCRAPSGEKRGYGGGMYLDVVEASAPFVVAAPQFTGENPNAAKEGNNLFVVSPNLIVSMSNSTLPFAVEMEGIELDSMRGFNGSDRSESIPLILYFKEVGSKIYVSGEGGKDIAVCGFDEYPCKSADYCLMRLGSKEEKQVVVKGSVTMGREIDLSDVDIRGEGERRAEMDVIGVVERVSGKMMRSQGVTRIRKLDIKLPAQLGNGTNAVFYSWTAGGELRIEDCWMGMKSGEAEEIEYNLICTEGNVLSLNWVRIEHMKSSQPLFSLSLIPIAAEEERGNNRSIEIRNSSFTSVTIPANDCVALFGSRIEVGLEMEECNISDVVSEGSGEGGAMKFVVEGLGWVEVMKCMIDGCKAETTAFGKGGGIYVECGRGFPVSFSEIVFERCDAYCGKNIFAKGYKLWSDIEKSKLNVEIPLEKERLNEFVGYDEEESVLVPLAVFVAMLEGKGYVGGESGIDYPMCGNEWFACKTIGYMGEWRFRGEKANVLLQNTFSFRDRIVLDEQSFEICAQNEGGEVRVEGGGGGGEGSGLIEIRSNVQLEKMALVLPSVFEPVARECLFLSKSASLTLEEMEMKMEASVQGCRYWIVKSVGGSVKVRGMVIRRAEFTGAGVIEMSGAEVLGNVNGLVMEEIKMKGVGGLVVMKGGAKVEVMNSSVKEATFENHCGMYLERGSGLVMTECNMSGVKREGGDGGGVAGVVGSGQRVEMKGCVLKTMGCSSSGSGGGSVKMVVEKGGEFVFDSNEVRESKVPALEGNGGGVHLTLEDKDQRYSMKGLILEENDAKYGKDVYLVCPSPREMVDPLLWSGSASKEEEERRKWVVDPGDERMNMTLLRFLFPLDEDIIYVDEELGREVEGCGSSVNPCNELGYGYGKLGDAKTILHIQNKAKLVSLIERADAKLTIRGEELKSELIVEEAGRVVLKSGTQSTWLTFQNIMFTLYGSGEEHDDVIVGNVGRVWIVGCEFGSKNGTQAECSRWIVCGGGSSVQIENSTVGAIEFVGRGGLCKITSGSVVMVGCFVEDVKGKENSMILCQEGANVCVNETTITGCEMGSGGLIEAKNASTVEILEGTKFEGCSSDSGDGACIHCEVGGRRRVAIKNAGFKRCIVNERCGRGGGIYLRLKDDVESDIELSGLEFRENIAFAGRDVFVECEELNKSVKAERLQIEMFDADGRQIAFMEGTDNGAFNGFVADLGLFLFEYCSGTVAVCSQTGIDIAGCGRAEMPCNTFWSGFQHVNWSASGMKQMVLEGTMSVRDTFCVSLLRIVSSSDEKNCIIHFEADLEAVEGDEVFLASADASFSGISFVIPSAFAPERVCLVLLDPEAASFAEFSFKNCTFQCVESVKGNLAIGYCLIEAKGGMVGIENCTFGNFLFSTPPLVFLSAATIDGCTFESMETSNSKQGGAIKVNFGAIDQLIVKKTKLIGCVCSVEEGKGGGMYVDCAESTADEPFVFENMIFEKNKAFAGENVFVVSSCLNSTVTEHSFLFSYEQTSTNGKEFMGSDDQFVDTDLLRFLVLYKSSAIHVSSSGADVKRCGSEAEPCQSFWSGMSHIERNESGMEIAISGETTVADEYDVSMLRIGSYGSDAGEQLKGKVIIVGKQSGRTGGYFVNRERLEVELIHFVIRAQFDSFSNCVIVNEEGRLEVKKCGVEMRDVNGDVAGCSFVEMRKGELNVEGLEMEASVIEKGVFVIFEECRCKCEGLSLLATEIRRGCLFEIADGLGRANERGKLELNDSSLSTISRGDNGGSVIHVGATGGGAGAENVNGVDVEVSGCEFVDCKAEASIGGGVMFVWLREGGALRVRDTTMMRCSCSSQGRGGGVYIGTDLGGKLEFVFERMVLKGNTAGVGNDIYVRCVNISQQINETQFRFSLRESDYSRRNAIFGCDATDHVLDTDLMDFITIYESDMIVVSSLDEKKGKDIRQCGTAKLPCVSVGYGVQHLTNELMSVMLVDEVSVIEGEVSLKNMTLESRSKSTARVEVVNGMEQTRECVIEVTEYVVLSLVRFEFGERMLNGYSVFISVVNDSVSVENCVFGILESSATLCVVSFCLIHITAGEGFIGGCSICGLSFSEAIFEMEHSSFTISSCDFTEMECRKNVVRQCEGNLAVRNSSISKMDEEETCEAGVSCSSVSSVQMESCTIRGRSVENEKGSVVTLVKCGNVKIDSCTFLGSTTVSEKENGFNGDADICSWNGSIVSFENCEVLMKDTTITNSSEGGITMNGGSVIIEAGNFSNNNPSIEGYSSLRRNIICSDSGTSNMMSLKGGDGVKDNSSLWILNEGCTLGGIVSERDSSFFIPVLESVEAKEETDRMKLTFKGLLLIPCNLSFSITKRKGEEKEIEKHDFDTNGFLSEREIEGSVTKDLISSCGDEIEVSVHILFGNAESPSSTHSFILKNTSETKQKDDERISEGGKEGKSSWALIVIVIFAVLFLVVLVASIVATIRWRRAKEEAQKYKEIVNDNIRKDPKAFEMVTMEMSPEEQWRRAEREAEKKNDERMKKRIYDTNMEHSESSEHLLSESGSTEYILGRDSDKIPEWALEKVEEEETRKRTPSPSISSTSTTDTSDTNTTFVRGEDLCPTTSSMSNLVDAMACSSPHEKLIVDLRDSLFMLLHGRNEKKEMAIGTLQEREMTAAQILFWVANLALHSFDEMNNPLQSLSNLSPHIVLFSEHMVICIALHSDCSSSDSDSSSISSSTVVTSTSDDGDERDSLPSSAFEDEEDNRNECLRWKAPELLNGTKKHATKKTVVFSIGMMLWECLTLKVPFGEYEAEVAGQKIVNGERPCGGESEASGMHEMVKGCRRAERGERVTLMWVKRELFGHFPGEAAVMTMTDAILYEESKDNISSCESLVEYF
ncbi:uncharacterized protein MONOS_107 [Monocercomonoides exilis]|uniref:uncharacterized protein n=1 Tax=Monocercomonoides exilis TaxID=2049356 RepID=UPI00355A37CF|nr:hypothetical protein MONOS_107 [Monocercomonoides exilis]|eukprot:MONOS_107.1-p1 / transcript=MONOS_107.1 / gene=MONOS_107 / organism=Monocercomonoides_exilis_PA203 / gene_product=unspecified product / transcript_product=unspecified product / location=Mono_scaffold00002:128605-140286(-) / protein_length=3794 / sequence_SO=supercontig / SO=protein_coding / is_pseudo=false